MVPPFVTSRREVEKGVNDFNLPTRENLRAVRKKAIRIQDMPHPVDSKAQGFACDWILLIRRPFPAPR